MMDLEQHMKGRAQQTYVDSSFEMDLNQFLYGKTDKLPPLVSEVVKVPPPRPTKQLFKGVKNDR